MARQLTLVLVAAVALTATELGCSNSATTSPSALTSTETGTGTGAGTCRTYMTSGLVTTSPLSIPGVQNSRIAGSYNSATRQFTYTVSPPDGTPGSTSVYTYASTPDVVDEGKALPPAPLAPS